VGNRLELPTRLLDLGGPESHVLRLVAPPSGTKGKYVALSYCWGDTIHFTTNQANLVELSNGFHVRLLPPTIQDTVEFTKALGFKYLWVDALCIIQGNNDMARRDWEVESAKMSKVYGNAFVTIVASSARACDEGMFFQRKFATTGYSSTLLPHMTGVTIGISNNLQYQKSEEPQYTLQGPVRSTTEAQQIIQEQNLSQNSHYGPLQIRIPETHPRTAFLYEPINSRAWALQERLLSPRLLIYTWKSIFWHCDGSLQQSGCENGVPDFGHGEYKFRLGKRTLGEKDWEAIVQQYCSRSLTDCHDKLPAISGIAQKYQAMNPEPDKYLAGLWESDLPRHLLWVQFTKFYEPFLPAPRNRRPTSYRAPSWSWASIDGLVSFLHCKDVKNPFDYVLEVVSSHVDLEDDCNPFGRVKEGSLVLRGQLKQAKRIDFFEHGIFATEKVTGKEVEVGKVFLDVESSEGLELVQGLDSIFCLLVAIRPLPRCLVLTAVPGRQGVYSRIGTSCSDSNLWFEDAPIKTVKVI
jgi:hypothetical protein